MRKQALLIFAMAIEALVLLLILVVMLLGLVGIFLPILPGLFFIGIGAGLYGLALRSKHTRAIHAIHPYVQAVGNKMKPLKDASMRFHFKKLLHGRREPGHDGELILKYGMILAALNTCLTAGLIFASYTLLYSSYALLLGSEAVRFFTLMLFFGFSALSSIMWYRFGQVIGIQFHERSLVNAALTVLLALLPQLGIVVVFVNLYTVFPFVAALPAITTILATSYVATLAAVFSLLIVALGVMTRTK